jgi:hypothetical protein
MQNLLFQKITSMLFYIKISELYETTAAKEKRICSEAKHNNQITLQDKSIKHSKKNPTYKAKKEWKIKKHTLEFLERK